MPSLPGVYVHVPFCPTICPYCDFHVVRRHGGVVGAYLERLTQEAQQLFEQYPDALQTLYFGGGTPSFLRNSELEALRAALPWDVSEAEVTMEANPGTLNLGRAQLLKDLGINRLSLGVQSFDDRVLKTLGRAHARRGALQAVELALGQGFRTSVDLILGLPGQDFAQDLRQAAELGVGHVSAYTLQVEPGTPFEVGQVRVDEDLEAAAFEQAEQILGGAGFRRYEVSNFALPGQESRHNLLYWRSSFWGALGPSAVGFYPNPSFTRDGVFAFRRKNPPLPRWLAGEAPSLEVVSALEFAKEALMLGLRTLQPLDLAELEGKTGLAVARPLEPMLGRLEGEGLLEYDRPRLRVTPRGRAILHTLVLRLWEALEPGPA
ncbi:MAG: radical SAM family heme chaperone HemW [Meiothermus sp.]|nr:radical SAM family heme chaperone HemW [Meiothermus sp.]